MTILEGVLERQVLNAGSKSEHTGCTIDVNGATVPVVLVGENPFEQPTLTANVGRRVRLTGAMIGSSFRATSIEQVT